MDGRGEATKQARRSRRRPQRRWPGSVIGASPSPGRRRDGANPGALHRRDAEVLAHERAREHVRIRQARRPDDRVHDERRTDVARHCRYPEDLAPQILRAATPRRQKATRPTSTAGRPRGRSLAEPRFHRLRLPGACDEGRERQLVARIASVTAATTQMKETPLAQPTSDVRPISAMPAACLAPRN